ncbi:MAG: hypothetical protein IKC69_04610 [Clostridia bacterium]|nr:hypothetical protein [Clostridia bacterium]
MNGQGNRERKAHRPGGIFPLLAVALTVVSLVGLFSYLSPASALSRALEKTEKIWAKKENVLLFVGSALQSGSLSVEGDGLSLQYEAALPDGASLEMKKGGEDVGLYAGGDEVVLETSLLEDVLSDERVGAYAAWCESAFVEAGREETALMPLFLAASDPALSDEKSMENLTDELYRAAKPSVEREKTELLGKSEQSATRYRISLSSERLSACAKTLTRALEKEASRAALGARLDLMLSLLPAVEGVHLSSEALLADKALEAFCEAAEESELTLDFYVCGGVVAAFGLEGEWDGATLSLSLFLGEKPAKEEQSLTLTLSPDGEEELVLRAKGAVTDDSEQAFIRTFSYELTDSSDTYLAEKKSGEVRFSWGRARGDVGMRLITPEGEWNVGGTVEEYKEKKSIRLCLSRFERNKENLLEGELSLHISPEAEPKEPPEADGALFSEGEERASLLALLTESEEP